MGTAFAYQGRLIEANTPAEGFAVESERSEKKDMKESRFKKL